MNKAIKSVLKKTAGVSLIILGIIGMIMPILPGWWLAIIGFQILGFNLLLTNGSKKPFKLLKIKIKKLKLVRKN